MEKYSFLILKICLILGPSYAAAYFTDKMIYVVPTLAACLIIITALDEDKAQKRKQDDDDASLQASDLSESVN